MSRRPFPFLSVLPSNAEGGPPTVDRAREALGGRAWPPPHGLVQPGWLIDFLDSKNRSVRGVIVFSEGARCDVWIDEGRFQRIDITQIRSVLEPVADASDDPSLATDANAPWSPTAHASHSFDGPANDARPAGPTGTFVDAGAVSDELQAVAADALAFAQLAEGDPVRFLGKDGAVSHGVLAEKCRYGALVAADDKVFAIHFRRLWHASRSGDA